MWEADREVGAGVSENHFYLTTISLRFRSKLMMPEIM